MRTGHLTAYGKKENAADASCPGELLCIGDILLEQYACVVGSKPQPSARSFKECFPPILFTFGSEDSHLFHNHDSVEEAWAAHNGARDQVGAAQLALQLQVRQLIHLKTKKSNKFFKLLPPSKVIIAVPCSTLLQCMSMI